MWKVKFLLLALLWLPLAAAPVRAQSEQTAAVSDLWLDVSLGTPLVDWFNRVARPEDIARIEKLDLLNQVTVGRKLVVFKSAADAERLLPGMADQLDIIGYNLEHNPASPQDEQSDPVAGAQRMRALADSYGKQLAFGPDHDFAIEYGPDVAPYVDIFVLQVQRVQTRPQQVYDFVRPLVPKLKAANPDLQVSIQVRTEGDVTAIADLVAGLGDELNGVSILTSPNTVPVAEDLVAELRGRSERGPFTAPPPGSTLSAPPQTSPQGELGALLGLVSVLIVIGGMVAILVYFARLKPPG
jgi:hypothetical protein